MFVNFGFLRGRSRRRKEHEAQGLTLENSNLAPAQIATAQKALRILGMEPRLEELTKQDFVLFLYAMGLNPTDDIIDSKLRSFKLHLKRTFTFGQLAHVWHSMLQDLTDEDEILKRAFQFFDKDGNGEISVQELRTTMHELGDLLTDEEITAFMEIMDVNNDGAIGYTEFLATLKTQAPNLSDSGAQEGAGTTSAMAGAALGEEERRERQQEQEAAPQTTRAAGSNTNTTTSFDGPDGSDRTFEPQPLNVPSSVDQPPRTAGAEATTSTPFASVAESTSNTGGGSGGGGDDVWPSGSVGDTAHGGGLLERNRSLSRPVTSNGSATQLSTFPTRRQPSLKAGPSPPPPAALAEPLLQPDGSPTAPLRPNSRRMGQSVPMPRVPSVSGTMAHHTTPDQSGSLRRANNDGLLPGPPGPSGSGGGDGDTGPGLRAPSALDPGWGSGSGSEGTA